MTFKILCRMLTASGVRRLKILKINRIKTYWLSEYTFSYHYMFVTDFKTIVNWG